MLLKQQRTHGRGLLPTCPIGPRLVRHFLVLDILGPGPAHHGLEPGLASLRAGLDHLQVSLGLGLGHHGLDCGICWRTQLGICQGLYQRILPHLQGCGCLRGHCHAQTCQGFCWDRIRNLLFCKTFYMENYPSILLRIFSSRIRQGAPSTQTTHTGLIKG
jgi:hypothetical protein